MLDVIPGVGTDEIRQSDLFPGIQAQVLLLLPELVFQKLLLGRFDDFPKFVGIYFTDLFSIIFTSALLLALPLVDGPASVGVIQFTGIFNVDFRFGVNSLFFKQLVDDPSQDVQRAHGHRVAYGVCCRRAQLVDALSVCLCIRVCLNHRGVVEPVCFSRSQFVVVEQEVLDAEVQSLLQCLVGCSEVIQQLLQVVHDELTLPGVVPPVHTYNIRYVCQHHCMRIDESLTQERQYLVDGFQAECSKGRRQCDVGKFSGTGFVQSQFLHAPCAEFLFG